MIFLKAAGQIASYSYISNKVTIVADDNCSDIMRHLQTTHWNREEGLVGLVQLWSSAFGGTTWCGSLWHSVICLAPPQLDSIRSHCVLSRLTDIIRSTGSGLLLSRKQTPPSHLHLVCAVQLAKDGARMTDGNH